MRLLSRVSLPFALLALALAGPAVGAASAHGRSDVVGHVYVNDNTAGPNTIAAFNRHADGSLTPDAGSPFVAGGAGTGAGLASQGALQITDNGRYLVAVDAGSNQLSVLRIHRDGSLRLVRGGVVSSGGVLPVSVAIHDHLVYVANASAVGPNSPASASAATASCSRSPAQRSRCPMASSPATCCSTAMAASSSAPALERRRSTASRLATTDV